MASARNLPLPKVERAISLLAETSARTVGIGANLDNGELLKELVGKMELIVES